MPPGASAYRWCFVARNRIIAALAAATVVVQATEKSGSLTTADFANEIGRAVGAVPGPVTSRLSGGTHTLIQTGAPLLRDATDALDLLAERDRPRLHRGPARAPTPGPAAHPPARSGRGRRRHAGRARHDAGPGPRGARRPRRAGAPRADPARVRRPLGASRVNREQSAAVASRRSCERREHCRSSASSPSFAAATPLGRERQRATRPRERRVSQRMGVNSTLASLSMPGGPPAEGTPGGAILNAS